MRYLYFTLLGLIITFSCVDAKRKEKPNVVIIMADDLGFGDISFNGSADIKTPNIDDLAKSGMQFTDFYTSGPVCTPTRCALMTGRYQARFKNMEGAFHVGIDHIGLSPEEETLPKILKRVGYSTGMVGKWHIGAQEHMQPQNQGFDDFFGFLGGNIDYFRHCGLDGKADLYENGKPVTSGIYMTDLITKKSVDFIRQQKNEPFFLYVAYNAPHWPYQGPDDEELDVSTVNKWIRNGTKTNVKNMIEQMDKGVGNIVKCIREQTQSDNTIIIFCSDNGGDRFASNAPFKGSKGHLNEGGIRSPLFMVWPKKIASGEVKNIPCITMDISKTIIDMCGAKSKAKLDGINLIKTNDVDRAICWRNGGKKEYAVRKGKWKLYHEKGTSFLYNLKSDVAETTDVKAEFPEVLEKLENEYKKWEVEMPYKQTLFGKNLMNSK